MSRAASRRVLSGLLVLVAMIAMTTRAYAFTPKWQEWHVTADDARIIVDPAGHARVERQVRYRVVAGQLRAFDLGGVDQDVVPLDVTVAGEDGTRFGAHLDPSLPPGTPAQKNGPDVAPSGPSLHVTIDDPEKGLRRGTYVFTISYSTDVVKHLSRDGAMWKMEWPTPPSPEGRDGARVTFDFPPAPTPPRLSEDDDATVDTTLATVRRAPDQDEIELVRAHVAKGEAVTWSARVDPKALPQVQNPALMSRPIHAAPAPNRLSSLAKLALLLGLFFLAAILAKTKENTVENTCKLHATSPRPLLPFPLGTRSLAFAALVSSGATVLFVGSATLGALLLVSAGACVVWLVPRAVSKTRGPGAWKTMTLADLSHETPASHPLDAWSTLGAMALFVFVGAAIALGFALHPFFPSSPYLAPLCAFAFVPMWMSGSRAQLPPPLSRSARLLSKISRRINERVARAEIVARVPSGKTTPDEARLTVLPREPMPGLFAIEIGYTARFAATSFSLLPEVLVRAADGSCAARRVAACHPGISSGPGRRADERVFRVSLEGPSFRAIDDVLTSLVTSLTDRRAPEPALCDSKSTEKQAQSRRPSLARVFTGKERRRPQKTTRVAA